MKKILALLTCLTAGAHAYSLNGWNTGYKVAKIRMNGNNWVGFWVEGKQSNDNRYFGIHSSHPKYASALAILLTAKTTGSTIAFCACGAGDVKDAAGVQDVSGGIELE